MASQELKTRIIIRNDISTNWANANPTPSKAEICIETDTNKYKVGDGVTNWANLPYYNHINDGTMNKLVQLINKLDNDDFGAINDVLVNDTSVVEDKVAKLIVIDNLESTSSSYMLSARQGNELFKMVQQIPKAKTYENIQAMVNDLNSAQATTYNTGSSIFIQSLNVPDFWIYAVNDSSVQYTYTTDQALIDTIKNSGSIQIGYYSISLLETEKVDLTDYITNEEFAELQSSVSALNTEVENLSTSLDNLTNRVQSIEEDNTFLRSTDTFIINGGTSEV